ncbi:hypothetical protein [Chryseobacterium sp. ERMR1:04]|uniref:hypothetical protein n=1 Tax=Chryseobacterium sp. ERMR1:04 TaxID=1705393 RepID=UPI0006C87AFF|nr:hypothetical protein [Chryseobacterium sp. ERMR1:04]KPH11386.1 hypothetical protein AMQ68_18375 [Chryseobacterium sp. ERMR1:04]
MGFLKVNVNKTILVLFGIIFCFLIIRKAFDPNLSRYKYFDQYCNGIVVSNSYDETSHFNIVKSSDSNKIHLEDMKIITLIKVGDSIVKNKDATYFTVYKKK